jgi:hypothetical protein
MPKAPPASVPFSAAMVRHSSAARLPETSSQTGAVARPACASSRSAPAENTFSPAPVRIRARRSGASRASAATSASVFSIAPVSELALSGRSMITVQSGPSRSTRIMP